MSDAFGGDDDHNDELDLRDLQIVGKFVKKPQPTAKNRLHATMTHPMLLK